LFKGLIEIDIMRWWIFSQA